MDIYFLCSLKSPRLHSALFIFYLPVDTKKQKLLKTVPSLVGACTFTGISVYDVIVSKTSVFHLQWNLDIMKLYLTKSSIQ